jgi:hypothetical protein
MKLANLKDKFYKIHNKDNIKTHPNKFMRAKLSIIHM